MKRAICLLLLLSLLSISFFSCGSSSSEDGGSSASSADKAVDVDVDSLVKGICDKYGMTNGFIFTSSSTEPGEYLDEDLIASYYGDAADSPDFSKVESYCLYVDESDPKVIIDVGVFKMKDASYSETLLSYLKARVGTKIANGARYADIDVAMLKKAVLSEANGYVYYVVSYDVSDIAAEIAAALGK